MKGFNSYDLLEVQDLLGCYKKHLESYVEPDTFNEDCRELQVMRCSHLIELIEKVLVKQNG